MSTPSTHLIRLRTSPFATIDPNQIPAKDGDGTISFVLPRNIPENEELVRGIELLKSQLGDALHSIIPDHETGSAFLFLHPNASKFAITAAEASGFEFIGQRETEAAA